MSYTILIPASIDLTTLLETSDHYQNTKKTSTRKKMIDRAAILLYQIIFQRQKTKNSQGLDFVRLNSNCLRALVSDYNIYIRHFLNSGVLETDDSYSSELHVSKGYKFSQEVNSKDLCSFKITDKRLLSKLKNLIKDKHARKKYAHLLNWFKRLSVPTGTMRNLMAEGVLDEKSSEFYSLQSIIVDKLNDNKKSDYWTFKQGTSGRLYNPISNLSKMIRPHLIFDNKYHLVEIDIRNSIPYFSLLLFDSETIFKYQDLRNILKKANPDVFNDSSLEDELNQFQRARDFEIYRNQVLAGTLYDEVAELWNKKTNRNYDRGSAKKKLLAILNEPNMFDSREKEALYGQYPNVVKAFKRLKQGFKKTKKGKGKYRYREGDLRCPFAMFTQGVESWFVLDIVCEKLKRLHPDCPLFTIHDALYTTPAFSDLVRRVITDESQKIFGHSLSVKLKDLGKIAKTKAEKV